MLLQTFIIQILVKSIIVTYGQLNYHIPQSRSIRNTYYENHTEHESISQFWITKEFEGRDNNIKMHAFIVRDENIPPCCSTTAPISETRHFMCSGAILTLQHAITSASCMHFADMYEHHINAELAILVDAFSIMPYIAKISRYEMHPNYDYDVDSNDLSTYDLAILILNCSFPLKNLIVPRLPTSIYDDISHVCCGQNCELITIVQQTDNHHIAKILDVKYLPLPIHNNKLDKTTNSNVKERNKYYPINNKGNKYKLNNVALPSIVSQRVKKSLKKLAGAPTLFLQKPNIVFDNTKLKNLSIFSNNFENDKIQNIFDSIANARRKTISKQDFKSKWAKVDTISQESGANSFRNSDELVTSVDWKNIEEKFKSKISDVNKRKMEKFTKKLVDITMQRVNSIVDLDIKTQNENQEKSDQNRQNNSTGPKNSNLLKTFLPHLYSSSKNYSLNDFAQAFTKILKTVVIPPNNGNKLIVSSDTIIEEKNLGFPPPKYVQCPPLGTPVFKDGVLIAMVSYTCDDIQNWVEWKYVSISNNMNWIRKRISIELKNLEKQLPTSCDNKTMQLHSRLNKMK